MLLSRLNRKEKLKFLDLALYMASIDGDPSDFEKRLLNVMLAEVGEEIALEYKFVLGAGMDDTMNFFVISKEEIRNIVYFNLVRMTIMEDLYNTEEHFFLENIRVSFKISLERKKEIFKLVYNERDLRDKVAFLVDTPE